MFYLSFSRNTNLSPDHTSSTAQTFTSTSPFFNPISRAMFSFTSVLIPEAPLGQEIHLTELSGLFLKGAHEQPPDRLALFLRVRDTLQRVEEGYKSCARL